MSTTLGGFVAGGIAACGAVTVTHGFETVKTRFFPYIFFLRRCALIPKAYRLQLQGELSAKSQTKRVYTGVFQGVAVILRNEGIRGLMAGLGAAVYPPTFNPISYITSAIVELVAKAQKFTRCLI